MKDQDQESLESSRPNISAYEAVDFCLKQLYLDCVHTMDNDVSRGLTYEELIGALLAARDVLEDENF